MPGAEAPLEGPLVPTKPPEVLFAPGLQGPISCNPVPDGATSGMPPSCRVAILTERICTGNIDLPVTQSVRMFWDSSVAEIARNSDLQGHLTSCDIYSDPD